MKRKSATIFALLAATAVTVAGCSQSTSSGQSVSDPTRAAGDTNGTVDLSALSQSDQNKIGNAQQGFFTPVVPECISWAKTLPKKTWDSSWGGANQYGYECVEVSDGGLVGFTKWDPANPSRAGFWGPMRMNKTGFTQLQHGGAENTGEMSSFVEGQTSALFGTTGKNGRFTMTAASTTGVPNPLAGRTLQAGRESSVTAKAACAEVDEYFKCVGSATQQSPTRDATWPQATYTTQVRTFPTVFEFRSLTEASWKVQNENSSGFIRDVDGDRGMGGDTVPASVDEQGTVDPNAALLRAGYRSTKGTALTLQLADTETGGDALVNVSIPANTDSLTQASFPDGSCKVDRQPKGSSALKCAVMVTQGAVQTVSFVLTDGTSVVSGTAKGKTPAKKQTNEVIPPAGKAGVDGLCPGSGQKPKYRLCPELYNEAAYDLVDQANPEALNTLETREGVQSTNHERNWSPPYWKFVGNNDRTNYTTMAVERGDSGTRPTAFIDMFVNSWSKASQFGPKTRPMTIGSWQQFGANYGDTGTSDCYVSNYFTCDLTVQRDSYGGGKKWWGPQQGVSTNPVRIKLRNDSKNTYEFVDNGAVTGNFLASYALGAPSLVTDRSVSPGKTATYGGWPAYVKAMQPTSSYSTTLVDTVTGSRVNLNIVFGWKDGVRTITDSYCTAVGATSISPKCSIDTSKSGFAMADAGFTTVYAHIS